MASKVPKLGYTLVVLIILQFVNCEDKCRSGCDKDSGILKLTPGTTYKYEYDGKINILLSSAAGQQTSTEVKAMVFLTQQADCSQVLKLQNVQIIGPDGKKRVGIPSVDKPIILNNNNGALNDFICSEPDDNQNSLNLKRAIASFFQVNPEKTTEIDVFGQCPTQITKNEAGDVITVNKNKNLNRCTFRESTSQNIINSVFDINSEIKSIPLLASNLDSKQSIKAGVLNSASVVENYLFVPFSVGQNGAKATVESKLTLIGTSNDNPSTKCQAPKSIIFENPHPNNVQRSNAATIIKKVKEISQNIGSNVDESTAIHFVDLVKLLRVSKKSDILSVYNQVRSGAGISDKEGANKILLDAILIAGNGDTIEVAIELLKSKELNKLEENQLYLGFSHTRHVTENSIKSATDLLNRPNLPREAYLGIGSLAGKYCAQHKCENVDAIKGIIAKFSSKLADLKAAKRNEESDMIYVLKGLTNIGYLNEEILSKILSIAEDNNQPARLRVVALEAYQAAACKDKLRDSALKILQNIQLDSEIRIKAYLVLTICPNDNIGNALKSLLEKEPSQQVGGFISSHIKNIRSSANPDKKLAKAHLGFIHTPRKFLFDPRKYSFNGEFSYNVDAIGLSNNIEGNVIYSRNSWLPRSTSLNLTAEILGKRFNFLEVAVRQENLDKIIEHYLGPRGVLRKSTLQQNWDNAAKPIKELLENLKVKVDKTLRARRDVSNAEIDAINKKIQVKSNELDNNLDLDLSIKNFGYEVLFLNSHEMADKLTPQSIIDNFVSKIDEGLDKLKNFEQIFRSNLLFLDAELSYPTSLGFPLRLGLDGASNIQVKTEGKIDVQKLISESVGDDMDLKISIIPSATVTVIGRFSLDTPLLENGLKVASTIHTSSGAELSVDTFKEGLGLDVKLSFPVKKQKLIDLKHDIIFQTKENGIVLKNQRLKFLQNKDLSICIDHLVNYIGLEFCADVNGPNLSGKKVPILPFPLSGDAKATIKIERSEIDTFHYRREFLNRKEGMLGIKATLETIGQKTAKGVKLYVEGSFTPEMYLKVSLNSPIKNAEAEARLVFNNVEKVAVLSLKDENKQYTAKAGLKVESVTEKLILTPILEYTTPENQTPQKPPFHVDGKVTVVFSGNNVMYTFDKVKFIIPGQKTMALTGKLGTEGPEYFTDLTFSDGGISATIKGNLQVQPFLFKVHAQLKNSERPAINFNIKGEFKKNKENFSSSLLLSHGPDSDSKTNSITLFNSFHLEDSKKNEFFTKNKITYPLIKLDAKFDLEKTHKSLDYDTYLQFGEIKVGSELKTKNDMKHSGDYFLKFEVFGGKNKIELMSVREAVGSSESKIENILIVNGKKLEIHGKIKHHVKPYDLNVGADLIIKLPTHQSPFKVIQKLRLNNQEVEFLLKVLSGSHTEIDALLKANRNWNVNGHIKVDFRGVLNVNGNIKAQNGVGNGVIIIDAMSIKKSSKGETSFTFKRPTYNLDITIYPEFTNSKDKKLILSTKNRLTRNKFDSSSMLNLLGSELLLNFNGEISSFRQGKTLLNVDLTLPGKQLLAGKLQRDVSSKDGVWNSNNFISLEQRDKKETPGRKVSLKGVAKDTNLSKGILDIILNLAADDSTGKTINLDISLKRLMNGEEVTTQFEEKLTSSWMKEAISTSISSKGRGLASNFKFNSSFGPDTIISVQGNYDIDGKQKPFTGDVDVAITLPFLIVQHIKTTHSFVISNLQSEKASIELNGSLQTLSSNPQHLKIEGNQNIGSAQLHGQFSKPAISTFDVSGNYNVDLENKTGSLNGNLKVILPENKMIQVSGLVKTIKLHEIQLEASLDLPTTTFKSNKLSFHAIRNENNKQMNVELISDGKKYGLTSDLNTNPKDSHVDIKLENPDGKISEFAASIKKPTSARLLANIKIICEDRDFLLEGGLEANSENLNDFYVQLTANCPKFKINDILIKLGKSGAKGNNVNVLVTSAGKNVVSGSAAVSSRDEQGKYIVEGSGNFKVDDQEKSGNFKYIRTSLTLDKYGETGEEMSFDAAVGNKAIDAEFKLTNKEFRYLNSYCEESKQCAHVEINAKSKVEDILHYDNQIEITVDLRVLGIPNEFGLKAFSRRENWLLDQTVDIHFENAANKYQYSFYLHPKEVGISLTTPHRIISLEADAELPKSDIKKGGKMLAEVVFHTDKKNSPNVKTALKGLVDVDVSKGSLNAELTLNLAGQSKPLTIKYTDATTLKDLTTSSSRELIIDIFDRADQKIVVSITSSAQIFKDTYKAHKKWNTLIKSIGLGFEISSKDVAHIDAKGLTASLESDGCIKIGNKKYDAIIKLQGSPTKAIILIDLLNQPIVDAKYDINLQKGHLEVHGTKNILGIELVDKLEIKNYNTLTLEQSLKRDPTSKFIFNAGFIPSQIADVRASVQKGSNKNELFHASIKLDEKNFLQPDAEIHSDNIKELGDKVREFIVAKVKMIRPKLEEGNQAFSADVKHLTEKIKESVPDVSKSQSYYVSELHKFQDELATDKTLENIGELLKSIAVSVGSTIGKIINAVSGIVEKIAVVLNTLFSGILKTMQREVIPKLQEISASIITSLKLFVHNVSDVIFILMGKAVEILEAIQPQLKAIAAIFSEISEDLGRFIVKSYESIKVAIVQQLERLKNELKASPIINGIQTQFIEFVKNGLPSQDAIVNTMRAVTGAIKELVLMPEIQNVIDLIEQYLEKKILNKPVDDAEELGKIGKTVLDSAQGLTTLVSKEILPDLLRGLKLPRFNYNLLKFLPIYGDPSLKISVLQYLLNEDTTPFVKFLIRLMRTPYDWVIPPKLRSDVMIGEVITFDGKIYHFPGNCSYILVTDIVNENFTIFYTVEDQHLKSLTFKDKSGSITMLQNGKVFLDDVETNYPIHKAGLRGYRHIDRIAVHSDSGVFVSCEINLLGCGFQISGFYHGQLRGILGNANNEEFDDLTLPNGETVTSIVDLAPFYTIGKCDQLPVEVTTVKSHHLCDKIFGWESPFKMCFPWITTEKKKKACAYAVASNNPDAERLYSGYYTYKCWSIGVPVTVPDYAGYTCKNSISEHTVNDEFNVKLPGKLADVVFVVNTDKENEVLYHGFVKPLVQQLVTEFKAKGVSDVAFYFILYGGNNREVSTVTVKGDFRIRDQAPDIQFAPRPKLEKLVTGFKEIDKTISLVRSLLHQAEVLVAKGAAEEAYVKGLEFPYRAESIRSFIAITHDSCEQVVPTIITNFFFRAKKHTHLTLIMTEKNFKVKDAKTTKDVLGFTSKNVITLSEGKHNPKGSAALYKHLSHNNQCFNYMLSNDGDVYLTNHLLMNKNSKVEIVDIIAKNVVDKALSTEFELACTCQHTWKSPFIPFNDCEVVNYKIK